jgi:hypothetical protein
MKTKREKEAQEVTLGSSKSAVLKHNILYGTPYRRMIGGLLKKVKAISGCS